MEPRTEYDHRPLEEFSSHATEWTQELQQTGEPLVLTVEGKATVVMQDATTYRLLLQRLEDLETAQLIQAGMDDAAAGRTIPIAQAFQEIREKLGLER